MSNTLKNPYLSVVMCSRNDDHGGNALKRMQKALDALLEQLERHGIDSELILVDWNGPHDKPLLKDIIMWPAGGLKYCTIRSIIVPAAIHERYDHSDKINLHVIAALNCGIRRSRGEFILPKTMDLIYSEELISLFASKGLKDNERYRVDRTNVNRNAVQCNTLDGLLEYCAGNIIDVSLPTPKAQKHNRAKLGDLPDLHTNASGDFMLMSKKNWHLLRGYYDADIAGAYVDGLLCYASYKAGVKEVILDAPMRIYHIDHDNKFNDRLETTALPFQKYITMPFLPSWINKKIIGLYRRILAFFGHKMRSSVHGAPTLNFSEYQKMAKEIVNGKRSYILNDENWGLKDETLEEFVINHAEWDLDLCENIKER